MLLKVENNLYRVMETKLKEKYEAPVLQVVALKMEGIICESVFGAKVDDLDDFLLDPNNPFGGPSLSSANPLGLPSFPSF